MLLIVDSEFCEYLNTGNSWSTIRPCVGYPYEQLHGSSSRSLNSPNWMPSLAMLSWEGISSQKRHRWGRYLWRSLERRTWDITNSSRNISWINRQDDGTATTRVGVHGAGRSQFEDPLLVWIVLSTTWRIVSST